MSKLFLPQPWNGAAREAPRLARRDWLKPWTHQGRIALCFLWLSCVWVVPLGAQTLDERFLAGLRQRRLFSLAEKYCVSELEEAELSIERRATLALELAQTYAEHALYAPLSERDRYWNAAQQTAADFLRSLPPSASGQRRAKLLMQVQDALARLSQGELLRQEVQADLGDAARLEGAKAALRRAIAGLETAQGEIETTLREIGLNQAPAGELSSDQLAAWQRNVSYQLARALKNQALCYPGESPDRANSLSQAVEQLSPLAALTTADDTIWRSRAELVECLRLLQQFEPATQALGKLVAAQPPPAYLLRAMAEKIRLDLARGQLDDALASMTQGRTSAGQASAELDYAHLETMIAAWRAATQAGNRAEAAAWQQRATAQTQLLERDHGAYWMRLGETLLASTVAGVGDGNIAALRRAAESYYRGSRWSEALKTYDQAALLAAQSGDADLAFELAFTAAHIEHQRRETDAALQRFQQLGQRMPAHARAGEAHLLAIVNAAELARQASGAARAERMKAYEALLREHLSSWPNDKSADQARLWLGQLLESQREWRAAAATYRAVNAQHAEHEAAQRGALRAAELALQSAAAADRFDAEFQQDAARFAETLIVGPERQWPEKWSPLQLESALAAARLRLNYFVAGANLEPTERLLTTALAANPNAPAAWQAEARLLLIWAMTLQGQSAAALAQLDQLAGGTLASLLQVLEKCDALAAGAEDKQAIELAELALQLSRRIDSRQVELSETERRQFQTLQAAALVRAGHFGDALRLYQTLVARHPRDGAIQEAYAALLARATDSPSRRVALSKWREVESKTKSGEPRWFRARLAQAELLMQLNDQAAARKLLQLTAVLHPELGGPEMKARFEALLNSSGQ